MLLLQPAPLLSPSYMLHQLHHHAANAMHSKLESSASSCQAFLFYNVNIACLCSCSDTGVLKKQHQAYGHAGVGADLGMIMRLVISLQASLKLLP